MKIARLERVLGSKVALTAFDWQSLAVSVRRDIGDQKACRPVFRHWMVIEHGGFCHLPPSILAGEFCFSGIQAVANGGFETHPDYGRAKLNVADMNTSLAFIESQTGDLLETHELPAGMKKVSIRHIASCGRGCVAFAGQYEGTGQDRPQLDGEVRQWRGLTFFKLPGKENALLRNYTGSIAISRDLDRIAVSSPRGGVVMIIRRSDGTVLQVKNSQGPEAWRQRGADL